MSIGIQNLVERVSSSIEDYTKCTPLEVAQISGSVISIEQISNKAVANCASLPDAGLNRGTLIYLEDQCSYRFSDGESWANTFAAPCIIPLFSWGYNSFGQLGHNDIIDKSSPVSVVSGFSNWCQVSAGDTHSLGIRINGTIWGWGGNCFGQLGNETVTCSSSPVSVIGGFTDWCQVSAGGTHSLALKTNNTLWAWGGNYCGELGYGTSGYYSDKSSPVSVIGGFTDWCQVSAGNCHSLGLRSNGSLWSWGFNNYGQLGINTAGLGTGKSSPVSVIGGFTDWCQVSAGCNHNLGVRCNGSLWAWGYNLFGQIGDGTGGDYTFDKSSPVSVLGGFTDWCQVSAGDKHSLGLRSNCSLWSWGDNCFGQLGDGTANNSSSPVSVVGGFTNWSLISTGGNHSLALKSDGALLSWGDNYYGQLGNETTNSSSSPVSVISGITDWCQISAGFKHNTVIRECRGI
jgi:alpha-tubulin suppressor-like RCC1 family protein